MRSACRTRKPASSISARYSSTPLDELSPRISRG